MPFHSALHVVRPVTGFQYLNPVFIRAKLGTDKIRSMIHVDEIMSDWLATQWREGSLLAADSDVLKLHAIPHPTHSWAQRLELSSSSGVSNNHDDTGDDGRRSRICTHFLARFLSDSYVLPADSHIPQISKNVTFTIGIYFPPDYLCAANFLKVITLFSPTTFSHPNAAPPHLCVGRLEPGTGLVDILYQIHDLITFKNVGVLEDDSLNRGACQWYRNPKNWDGRPVDSRPLRRRTLKFSLTSNEA